METFALVVGTLLPYITILVFVGGMIYRFWVWAKLPSPGRPTLFPAPQPGTGMVAGVVGESLLFRRLFRADKALWTGAWVLHVALLLILLGHLRVVTDFPGLWNALGMAPEAVDRMSAVSGSAFGVVILAAAAFLLVRRLSVARVREISSPGDYLALLLLLGIFVTGDLMRFGPHFDLEQTRTYFAQLASFSFPTPPLQGTFLAHILAVQLLLIYIPFSKVLHFGGIFFTQTIMQRR